LHAEEVATILRQNIVQGKNVGDDRYSRYPVSFVHLRQLLLPVPSPEQIRMDSFVQKLTTVTELRIHAETERGDNDTIKMPNGQKITIDGKKCCS
jgi:complex III assembly factor LYRM7